MKVIHNGKLVLPNKVLTGHAILFDKEIINIIPENEIPDGIERIDAKGCYITPGFVDIHVHGSGGCDTMDGTEESMQTISKTIAKSGVTRFLATSVTMPLDYTSKVFDLLEKLKGRGDGAILEGVNMEGPFINSAYKGAHEEGYIADYNLDIIKRYSNLIKTVTVAAEKDGGMEFVHRIATETSVKISLGHSNATYEQAIEAINAGVSNITHLYNAMTPMHHRKPGVVTAALSSNVYVEMICDTIHVHPAMFNFVMDCKKNPETGICDKFILITDCMRAGGMPDGEYLLGDLKVYVEGGSARLKDGTLAGSVLTLNKAIKNVMDNTKRPIWEVVRAATLTPATAMGLSDRIGALVLGNVADFVIMDDECNVKQTIVNGNIV